MKRGLLVGLAFALLATGLLAVHCGGGVREDLAQLELRSVLGLQQDEVRYLFNNERLSAYDMLVTTARAQLDELSEGMAIEPGDVGEILGRIDEQRAADGKEPLIFVRLQSKAGRVELAGAIDTDGQDLINPVAFMDTVPAGTTVEFVYPDGQWSDQTRDDLLGHSELGVLNWLEPWMAALVKGASRIEVIRADGQTAFVALGSEPGQMRINPVLLHLAAARSHEVSTAAAAALAAGQPLVVPAVQASAGDKAKAGSAGQTDQADALVVDGPKVDQGVDGADGVDGAAMAGQLAQVEQALAEADVSGCTCACFEDGEGDCTHICYHDPDASNGEDECHYGCADDPESCATVTPVFGTDAHARKTLARVFHLGALALPGLILLGWVRRIRRRED